MKNRPRQLPEMMRQRSIVQHYPVNTHHSQHYPPLYHQHGLHFYEDQIYQEFDHKSIVEDYHPGRHFAEDEGQMEIEEPQQRMEEEPYLEMFPQQPSRFRFESMKMLDSASSGRQLPSRNSSVSSLSSRSQNQSPNSMLANFSVPKSGLEEQYYLRDQRHHEQKKIRPRRQVGSSTQKRERMKKIKKLQEIGCNCKKTKCLKMYCECFNLQILCGENCSCVDCGNLVQNEHHQKAVLDALTRNPKAFAEDAQIAPSVFGLGVQLSEVRKGCKCRKTKCRKKYCECFNSGQACGIFCQCQGCLNPGPSPR